MQLGRTFDAGDTVAAIDDLADFLDADFGLVFRNAAAKTAEICWGSSERCVCHVFLVYCANVFNLIELAAQAAGNDLFADLE